MAIVVQTKSPQLFTHVDRTQTSDGAATDAGSRDIESHEVFSRIGVWVPAVAKSLCLSLPNHMSGVLCRPDCDPTSSVQEDYKTLG